MNYNNQVKDIENMLFSDSEEEIKSKLYGHFSTLILSKKYAPSNSDLINVMAEFDLEFKIYVYKSRTVLLSRIIRIIEKKDETEIEKIVFQLEKFLKKGIPEVEEKKEGKNKKKKKNIFDDIFNQLG